MFLIGIFRSAIIPSLPSYKLIGVHNGIGGVGEYLSLANPIDDDTPAIIDDICPISDQIEIFVQDISEPSCQLVTARVLPRQRFYFMFEPDSTSGIVSVWHVKYETLMDGTRLGTYP